MEAGLRQKLDNDLKQAMRSGDTGKASVIRLVLAPLIMLKLPGRPSWRMAISSVLLPRKPGSAKRVSSAFKQGNRPDLVAQEEAELAILKGYLPQQMTRDEIMAEARQVIAEVGARDPVTRARLCPSSSPSLRARQTGAR